MRPLLAVAGLVLALLGLFLWWSGSGDGRGERPETVPDAGQGTPPPGIVDPLDPVNPVDLAPVSEERGLLPELAGKERPEVERGSSPDEALLLVRVVSTARREPQAGLRVYLFPANPGAASTVARVETSEAELGEAPVTDSEGRVRFRVPSDLALRLVLQGSDGHPGEKAVAIEALSPTEEREVVAELPPLDRVGFHGRVVDAETDRPLVQAEIRSVRFPSPEDGTAPDSVGVAGDEGRRGPALALTDTDGRFRLDYEPDAQAVLRVDSDGHAWAFVAAETGHERAERAREIRLLQSASLRGRIRTASGAAGDVALRLTAKAAQLGARSSTGHGGITHPDVFWERSTSAEGTFAFDALPPEATLSIKAERNGEAVVLSVGSIELRPGEEREVEWELGGSSAIRGVAVDPQGNPVPGLEVWLGVAAGDTEFSAFSAADRERVARRVKTDREGGFAFDELGVGAFRIGPGTTRTGREQTADPDAAAPIARRVEIEEPDTVVEVGLEVHRGLYVRGRVEAADGRPLAGATVSAQRLVFQWCTTDDEGRFLLGPLLPDEYALTARAFEEGGAPSDPVLARPGDEILLRLESGCALAGRSVDEAGAPVEASITLTGARAGARDGGMRITRTDPQGRFRTAGLVPGTYDLLARTADGRMGILERVEARAGANLEDLIVRVRAAARLSIRIPGPAAASGNYEILCGSLVVQRGAWAESGPTVVSVPSGPIQVIWHRGDGDFVHSLTANPGEEYALELEP